MLAEPGIVVLGVLLAGEGTLLLAGGTVSQEPSVPPAQTDTVVSERIVMVRQCPITGGKVYSLFVPGDGTPFPSKEAPVASKSVCSVPSMLWMLIVLPT